MWPFDKIKQSWNESTSLNKNAEAAKQDFLIILKLLVKEDPSTRSKIFLEAFENDYESCKKYIKSYEKNPKLKSGSRDPIPIYIIEQFDKVKKYFYQNNHIYMDFEKSKKLGSGFGILLALFQYGITSKRLQDSREIEPRIATILQNVRGIVVIFKKASQIITLNNTSARVLEIVEEKRDILNEMQINLLTEIAKILIK